MPVPPAVTGYTGLTQQTRLTIEVNAGEQLLFPQGAGAATLSLTTQPNAVGGATVGMHLHFQIIGNTGTGTMTIAGTAPGTGSAVNSITYHVNPAPLNNQGYSEFTTTEVFATVNASGITMSAGLLPCQVIIWGSLAGKFLIPVEADPYEEVQHYSPVDKRGILWPITRVQQLTKWASLGKFDASVFPDSLWLLYMLVTNNPTVTTVPAAPSSLMTSTAIAATMTLTTSLATVPPGMFMIFAITGNTASGTIVLNGKDPFGNAQNETIKFTSAATQTVYSTKRYSALTVPGANQFATTGGTGSSIVITGVFAWTYTGTWDGLTNTTKASACLEHFDGVQGVMVPYTFFTDGTLTWEKEKELLVSCKGEGQDFLIVGDPNPTTYPSGTNPFATLSQPTTMPMVGWSSQYFIDALPGTPFTTQDGSIVIFKVVINTGLKAYFVGDGMQRWNNMTYGGEPSCDLEATLVYQNYQYYESYFKQNSKFVLGVTFQGTLLGSIGASTYFENIQFTFPARIDTLQIDKSKDPIEASLKIYNEYDFASLGYAFKMAMTAQIPPTYTS